MGLRNKQDKGGYLMLPIELVFLIGMALLLFLALKVKVNAFMSLLATAMVMGLLARNAGHR